MTKYIMTLLSVAAVLTACNPGARRKNSTVSAENTIVISAGGIEPLAKASDAFKPVDFITLELNDNSFIGYADKTVVLNEHIIVASHKQRAVFIFDRKGNHLATYDRQGGGPGEFIELIDMCYDEANQEIFILDISKITVIGFDGRHLRDIPLEIGGLRLSYSEKFEHFYFVIGRGYPTLIGKVDRQGNLVSSYFEKGKINALTGKNTLFKNDGEVLIKFYLNDTIYSVGKDQIDTRRYIDFDRKITVDQYTRLENEYSIDNVSSLLPKVMSNINFYAEFDNGRSVGIFHYQGKKHSFFYDEDLADYRVFDMSETENDLTFEAKVTNFETLSPEGYLVSVLNAEELTEESVALLNSRSHAPQILKEIVVGKTDQNSNPIVMLSKVDIKK